MLKSVLLYLENVELARSVIQVGVTVASEADARVRDLTLLDRREFDAARHLKWAAYLSQAVSRNASTECTLVLGIGRSCRWMQRLFRQPSLVSVRSLDCGLARPICAVGRHVFSGLPSQLARRT